MISPTFRGRMMYQGAAGDARRVDVSERFVKRLTGCELQMGYVMPSMPDAGSDSG